MTDSPAHADDPASAERRRTGGDQGLATDSDAENPLRPDEPDEPDSPSGRGPGGTVDRGDEGEPSTE